MSAERRVPRPHIVVVSMERGGARFDVHIPSVGTFSHAKREDGTLAPASFKGESDIPFDAIEAGRAPAMNIAAKWARHA